MHIDVTFPGNKRVAARVGSFEVMTDQPTEAGGDGSAPPPYELFLASVGACAGLYALTFCQVRGLSTVGLHLDVLADHDPTGVIREFRIQLTLPGEFPQKYRSAIVRAVEQCKVKKALGAQPAVRVALEDEVDPQRAFARV